MGDEKLTSGQISLGIIFLLIILGGYILSDYFIEKRKGNGQDIKTTQEKIDEIIKEKVVVKTPEEDEPEYNGKGGIPVVLEELVISGPYNPTLNANKNNMFSVGMKGDFEVAALMISGRVKNDLANFLSITVGLTSGTYGMERLNENALSKSKMDLNYIYTKGEFEEVIDLLRPQKFATTRYDYLSTGKKFEDRILWDYIYPPSDRENATIGKFFVSMFDQNGVYGNDVEITEVKLIFACAENDEECDIVICGKEYDPGSSCLVDKFSPEEAMNYIEKMSK